MRFLLLKNVKIFFCLSGVYGMNQGSASEVEMDGEFVVVRATDRPKPYLTLVPPPQDPPSVKKYWYSGICSYFGSKPAVEDPILTTSIATNASTDAHQMINHEAKTSDDVSGNEDAHLPAPSESEASLAVVQGIMNALREEEASDREDSILTGTSGVEVVIEVVNEIIDAACGNRTSDDASAEEDMLTRFASPADMIADITDGSADKNAELAILAKQIAPQEMSIQENTCLTLIIYQHPILEELDEQNRILWQQRIALYKKDIKPRARNYRRF
ncbi:MAG: hypothetical protein V4482_05150 [Pseudomonadota bacterium]